MAATFKVHLRAGERFYLNGALVRAERKVTLTIENKAVFLLEEHVMAASAATTPLRQHYIAVQSMIIEPMRASELMEHYRASYQLLATIVSDDGVAEELVTIDTSVVEGRLFEGLNRLKALIVRDETEVKPGTASETPTTTND